MRLALLALALLLAGCASDDGSGPAPGVSPSATAGMAATASNKTAPLPAAEQPRTFSHSFPLSLSEAYGATKLVLDGNCGTLSGGGQVVNGTVTATWTAATPSAQMLALVSGPADAPTVGEALASPATWAVVPAAIGDGLAFGVVLPGPGAAYQQAVALQLDLQVVGAVDADPTMRACVA